MLKRLIDGKRVALIGPSPHLINSNNGDFIDSFDDLVVVKLKSEKSICPIDVVKVILPNTLQYEQSEMFTGIPRAL